MAITPSRFYNNPEIGQGFANLAAAFAPPDASDTAAYALARERNQRAGIIDSLRTNPAYAGFDHQAILADLFDPTQSFTRVNMDDATARRGQDVTAATSRANNAMDNRTRLVSDMFGPLNQGQVRPALPAQIAGSYDLPSLEEVIGAPKPLSETEWNASQSQRLLQDGTISDQDILNLIMGDVPVENIVGPDGKPVIAARPDAIGQEPFFNKGAEAKPDNAVALLGDGTRVPAVQGADLRWRHAQTGAELPSNIEIFDLPRAQGTSTDVGLSRPTDTYIEKQLIDIRVAKDTAQSLRDLIASSPASQGLVGWLRGTAQNVIQTGGELGDYFGGEVAEVAKDIQNGLADASLSEAFDPNIPAIEMLANLLAFQYAKTTTGERLSNEMLRASRQALGLNGLDANQANSLARIDQAIKQIEAQESILNSTLERGLGADVPAQGETTTEEWVRGPDGQLRRAG